MCGLAAGFHDARIGLDPLNFFGRSSGNDNKNIRIAAFVFHKPHFGLILTYVKKAVIALYRYDKFL